MFLASHIAAGSLIYDAIKDEPTPLRLALGLGGCFISHWLLDVSPIYHDMSLPWSPVQWLIAFFNVAGIGALWWGTKEKKWYLPSNRVLWGLAAWLLWDAWWLVDTQGGPHRLTTAFNGRDHWADPRSFVIEALWIGFAVLLSLPAIRAWRERKLRLR